MTNHPLVSPLIDLTVVPFGDVPHKISLSEQDTVLLLLHGWPPDFKPVGTERQQSDEWRCSRCGVAQRFLQPINRPINHPGDKGRIAIFRKDWAV
jgi:hypothetical protein